MKPVKIKKAELKAQQYVPFNASVQTKRNIVYQIYRRLK